MCNGQSSYTLELPSGKNLLDRLVTFEIDRTRRL